MFLIGKGSTVLLLGTFLFAVMTSLLSNHKKYPTKSGLNALVWKEGDWFVSKCLEVELASQGKTRAEALNNLEEALELYFEDEKLPAPTPLKNLEVAPVYFSYA